MRQFSAKRLVRADGAAAVDRDDPMEAQRSSPYRRQMKAMEGAEREILAEVEAILEAGLEYLILVNTNDMDDAMLMQEFLKFCRKYMAKVRGHPTSIEVKDDDQGNLGAAAAEDVAMKMRPFFVKLMRDAVERGPPDPKTSTIELIITDTQKCLMDPAYMKSVFSTSLNGPVEHVPFDYKGKNWGV